MTRLAGASGTTGATGRLRMLTAGATGCGEGESRTMTSGVRAFWTGGVGCEPGYNYYFPALHTKIHVIKAQSPPWRLPAGMSLHFGAYHVPTNTTVAELLKGFGATNSTAKKNRVTEVVQGGNGKWYKGLSIAGDDKDDLKKGLKDLGWDHTRTGRPGEKPVVWLWITRD